MCRDGHLLVVADFVALTGSSKSSNLYDMKRMTANEAKQSFGQVLDAAQSGPVLIEKHNRPSVVVLSVKDYDRMRGINLAEFSRFSDRIGARAARRGLDEKTLRKMLASD